MDGFDTICLDTNICDICSQDTGEELINCILNDRCLQVGDASNYSPADSSLSTEPFKQAHKDCLDRWKSVIQSTLNSKCPSPKRSWKDKFKDLLNRNVESTSDFAWVEVDSSKSSTTTRNLGDTSISHANNINTNSTRKPTQRNTFLTKEEYRVEQVNNDIEECLERGRKLRVRSVDIEDDSNESLGDCSYGSKQEKGEKFWNKEKLNGLKCNDLLEIYKDLNKRIEETSTLLVSKLEEKDSLRQQHDSLNTTVAQLVQLQQKQKIKTLSLDFEHQQHLVT